MRRYSEEAPQRVGGRAGLEPAVAEAAEVEDDGDDDPEEGQRWQWHAAARETGGMREEDRWSGS